MGLYVNGTGNSLSLLQKLKIFDLYHGLPSLVCWEANSKKYTIQPDVLIDLESSPPYIVVLKHSSRFARFRFLHGWIFLSFICSTTLVALLVIDLSVSILNLTLFCSICRLALLVVDLSLSQSFWICFFWTLAPRFALSFMETFLASL